MLQDPPPLEPPPTRGTAGVALYLTWLLLMGWCAVVELIVSGSPETFRSIEQAQVFAWPMLAALLAAGWIGIWCAGRVGLAAAWQRPESWRRRWLAPIAIGLLLGVLEMLLDVATGFTARECADRHIARENIELPWSLLIYPGGAVIVECFYRLFPLPLLQWLIDGVLRRRRASAAVFWSLAVLTSLLEPLSQDLGLWKYGWFAAVAVFGVDFLLNLAQAAVLRRHGFTAAIALRVAFYAVWHVAYPH